MAIDSATTRSMILLATRNWVTSTDDDRDEKFVATMQPFHTGSRNAAVVEMIGIVGKADPSALPTFVALLDTIGEKPVRVRATMSADDAEKVLSVVRDTVAKAIGSIVIHDEPIPGYVGPSVVLSELESATADLVRAYVGNIIGKIDTSTRTIPTGSRRTVKSHVTGQKVTLNDMVSADVIHNGDTVTAKVGGKVHTGTIDATGEKVTIVIGKTAYDTVSAAAESVTGYPVNGWTFWAVNGKSLSDLRSTV